MPELDMPTLSVVVIGRNEGERLRRCLDSIADMEPVGGGFEVIYVDSCSTDTSVEIALSFGARVLRLEGGRPSAARARNKGWRVAKANWILFLDGDTILDSAFPRLAMEAAVGSSAAAVWGHRRELRPHANLFHRVLDLDWVYPAGESEFCGGDALMRLSALVATGGFDDALIAGEEPELCARLRALGYSIQHIDAPMTKHDLAISRWSQYWRRACRAGYAYSQIAWQTRDRQVQLWGRESTANVVRAVALLIGLLIFVFSMFISPWFAAAGTALACLVLMRSAWRARWKSGSGVVLMLYAVHSHLQQIPIFLGQLSFWWDLTRNRRRSLMEYK